MVLSVEGAMPGDDTDALPAIWDNWEDFESRANQLITDADSLVDAAASGSMDEIKPAFMAAAKNCKGCHDQYKDGVRVMLLKQHHQYKPNRKRDYQALPTRF